MPKDPVDESSESNDEPAAEDPPREAAKSPKKAGTPSPAPTAKSKDEDDEDEDEDDEDEDEDDEDDEEDEDEDDEDENEDDEDEDDEDDRGKAKAKAGPRPVARRPASPPPSVKSEREIDAPDVQTLGMIAVLAVLVLILWGAARFACNAHPPQTMKPRTLTVQELARDPKDAAIELQQRWSTWQFDKALELAAGPVALELKSAQAKCASDKAACEAKQKALADKVLTTGELLSRDASSASVKVTTEGGPDGKQSYLMQLQLDGRIFKVASRAPAPAGEQAPVAPASP